MSTEPNCKRCGRPEAIHIKFPQSTCGTFYAELPDLGPKILETGPGWELTSFHWTLWEYPWKAKCPCGMEFNSPMPSRSPNKNCNTCGEELDYKLRKGKTVIEEDGSAHFVEDESVYD